MSAKRPGQALRQRDGVGRRSGRFSRWRPDPRPTGRPDRAVCEVGATAADRGAAGRRRTAGRRVGPGGGALAHRHPAGRRDAGENRGALRRHAGELPAVAERGQRRSGAREGRRPAIRPSAVHAGARRRFRGGRPGRCGVAAAQGGCRPGTRKHRGIAGPAGGAGEGAGSVQATLRPPRRGVLSAQSRHGRRAEHVQPTGRRSRGATALALFGMAVDSPTPPNLDFLEDKEKQDAADALYEVLLVLADAAAWSRPGQAPADQRTRAAAALRRPGPGGRSRPALAGPVSAAAPAFWKRWGKRRGRPGPPGRPPPRRSRPWTGSWRDTTAGSLEMRSRRSPISIRP